MFVRCSCRAKANSRGELAGTEQREGAAIGRHSTTSGPIGPNAATAPCVSLLLCSVSTALFVLLIFHFCSVLCLFVCLFVHFTHFFISLPILVLTAYHTNTNTVHTNMHTLYASSSPLSSAFYNKRLVIIAQVYEYFSNCELYTVQYSILCIVHKTVHEECDDQYNALVPFKY